MLEAILGLPEQCDDALALSRRWSLPFRRPHPAHLVVTGMGGSAMGGDLLRCAVGHVSPFPIWVNRQYQVPQWVNDRSFVIAVSYSGNTEETLAAYQDAKRRRARLAVVASGGRLLELARRDGIPALAIPTGYAPRAALGYTFIPQYVLWARFTGTPDRELRQAISALRLMRPVGSLRRHPAWALARRLHRRRIFLYGSQDYLEAAVFRWRTQIEENAKQLASHHLLPEMNHNEIVGWLRSNPEVRQSIAVFLVDPRDHPRIRRRVQWSVQWIRRAGGQAITVPARGPTRLARLLSVIYLGDLVSYGLALLNRQDPTPVPPIASLKAFLAS